MYNEISIKNICERKTLSGLDPIENDICINTGFDDYFEWWSYDAQEILEKLGEKEFIKLLNEVNNYEAIGELLVFPAEDQTDEMAAFLLVLLDRFGKNAESEGDPWKCTHLFHKIYECAEYISPMGKNLLRMNARKAAHARHAENRSMKKEAYHWFTENGCNLTKDEAAIEITKQVPIKLRTAQDWVTQFRKKLRSAC